jgi:hypothetical protein
VRPDDRGGAERFWVERLAPSSLGIATVTIVVHGVGDHSHGDIVRKAAVGLAAVGWKDVETRELERLSLGADEGGDGTTALEITAEGHKHLLIPLIWSRLRPRAAKEADVVRPSLYRRLLRGVSTFLPSGWDAIRCIRLAPDARRRLLVALVAGLYALLAPALAAAAIYFLAYVSLMRAAADAAHFAWWRIPALLVSIWLLQPIVTRVLAALDFVGDVVTYVGNPSRRKRAEDRLIAAVAEVARRAPQAEIVLVAHSLGSVLVTHTVLKLADPSTLGQRTHIVTMGSPLRMMSWFFPKNVLNADQLLRDFASRRLVASWVNVWRDSDLIGRALQPLTSPIFVEKSLGDGGHADYWADPRSWSTVVSSLRSAAQRALPALAAQWLPNAISDAEELELQRRARFAAMVAFINVPILVLLGWLWQRIVAQQWLVDVGTWTRWIILTLAAAVTILTAVYYLLTSKRVGGDGASRREMLARYRRYWDVAIACAKVAGVLSFVAALVWWRSS